MRTEKEVRSRAALHALHFPTLWACVKCKNNHTWLWVVNVVFLMLTLNMCKEVLNKGDKKFSDNEIELIRNFLYEIASIQIEVENKFNNKK